MFKVNFALSPNILWNTVERTKNPKELNTQCMRALFFAQVTDATGASKDKQVEKSPWHILKMQLKCRQASPRIVWAEAWKETSGSHRYIQT